MVFAWEGYRSHGGGGGPGREQRTYAFFAAAAVCFGLGLWGVRERHRVEPREDTDSGPDLYPGDDPD
jgi:hypothetical protein